MHLFSRTSLALVILSVTSLLNAMEPQNPLSTSHSPRPKKRSAQEAAEESKEAQKTSDSGKASIRQYLEEKILQPLPHTAPGHTMHVDLFHKGLSSCEGIEALLSNNIVPDRPRVPSYNMAYYLITRVTLSHNHLTEIDDHLRKFLGNLHVLMTLDLSHNELRFLPDNFLASSKCLQTLHIQGNPIDRFNFVTFEPHVVAALEKAQEKRKAPKVTEPE